jgi:hypothetical protein
MKDFKTFLTEKYGTVLETDNFIDEPIQSLEEFWAKKVASGLLALSSIAGSAHADTINPYKQAKEKFSQSSTTATPAPPQTTLHTPPTAARKADATSNKEQIINKSAESPEEKKERLLRTLPQRAKEVFDKIYDGP